MTTNNLLTIWENSINKRIEIYNSAIKTNEIIKFLINKLKIDLIQIKKQQEQQSKFKQIITSISSSLSTTQLNYTLDYCIYKETLQTLIDSCYSIIVLGLSTSSKKVLEANKKRILNELRVQFGEFGDGLLLKLYSNEPFEMLTMNQLDQFKSEFTDIQLSTKLYNFQYESAYDGVIQENKDVYPIIEKLIKMVIPFIGISSLTNNYLFYISIYKQIDYTSELFKVIQDSFKSELFFLSMFCSGRVNRQIEYTKSYYFKKTIYVNESIKNFMLVFADSKLFDLLKEIIDNLALLNQRPSRFTFTNSISVNFDYEELGRPSSLLPLQLFDYVYKLSHNIFNINHLFPARITILKYFKLKYPNDYKNTIGKANVGVPHTDESHEKYAFYYDAIEFIVENIEDFETNLKDQLTSEYDFDEEFINSILRNPRKLKLLFKKGVNKSIRLFKYYDNGGVIEISNKQFQYSNTSYQLVIEEIVKKCDLISLEVILNSEKYELIKQVLEFATFYAKLEIFNYIHSSDRHNVILNPSSNLRPLASLNTFKDLVRIAKYCYHLHILYYFKNVLKFDIK